MKKIVLAMLAMLAMTTAVSAQSTDDTKATKAQKKTEMIEKRTQKMVEKYSLNAEQAAKLKVLNEKYANVLRGPHHGMKKGERPEPPKDMKDGERPEPPKDMKKGERPQPPKEIQEYEAGLKEIMTADQYKAYQADKEKRMQKHDGHKNND